MRLLHTSDWHLGKFTYNQSRRPDHVKVHGEILAIAKEFRPDLVVHTGDVFDNLHPAVDDLRLGIEMLDELAEVAPTMVLCGNHDGPKYFKLFTLLRRQDSNLRFVDRALPPDQGGIYSYPTRNNETIRVAPVPFVNAMRFVEHFEDPATWAKEYAKRIALIEKSLEQGLGENYKPDRDILIFAAHLYVAGAKLARSEREVHVGPQYASLPESIPAVTYAAFGHIHKPQALPGRTDARYAGSPIPIDFGEIGEQKSLVLVDAKPGRAPKIETAPLSGGRPLRRLSGTLEELRAMADGVAGSMCLVTVQTAVPTPLLFEQVAEILCGSVILDVAEHCAAGNVSVAEPQHPGSEAQASLDEMFGRYLTEHGAKDADNERVLRLFRAVTQAVDAGEEIQLEQLEPAIIDTPK